MIDPIVRPLRRNFVISSQASCGRVAMAVFVDGTECCWLRGLRRGFRHCFVALEHGDAWLVCDSLKSHMELTLLDLPRSVDLGRHYAGQGHRVLIGRTGKQPRQRTLPPGPLTCVSVAKRLLAIRAARVWTPWQLFSYLLRQPHVWRLVP
ncbi:MAG TPA: hypothetical protein VFV80_08460 [Geminicoccaceae bacterium]|nr:hypothetical protein [Geminicoccaceae bacterium]